MIQYVELIPTKEAAKQGCVVTVEVPLRSYIKKVMVKNNAHIRVYYEVDRDGGGNLTSKRFLLAPTGVDCSELSKGNPTRIYLDSVEIYGDTLVFHVYQLS